MSSTATNVRSRHAERQRHFDGPSPLKPLVLALLGVFPLHGLAAPAANAVPKAPAVGWRVSGSGPTTAPINVNNTAGGVDQSIAQTSKTGIYNWQSFDIGKSSSVTFTFQSKDSSALNRVTGSASPSQIFGSLKSQYANPDATQGGMLTGGSLYLINANGILFGSGARVNVGSLVASTLDLSNADYLNGFANTLTTGDPTFKWDSANGLFSTSGNYVRVDPDAKITTASGGRVFLFAKKVENAGTIATPDGQTVLAAGSEVYLQNPTAETLYASEANSLYPVVNGLLVEVGKGDGTVSNLVGGSIETLRGNTTLVGMAVNQSGRISASTSVSQNGSVMLLARGNAVGALADTGGGFTKRATASGTLTLGAGSSIEIAPDTTPGSGGKPATSDGNAIFTTSRVELAGKTIDIQGGASIVAHGGIVNARAQATPYYQNNGTDAPLDTAAFNGDDSVRLAVGNGAVIDVSGTTTATVSTARNFVTTELIGKSDLKDAPLQKDGVLYRSKLTFDLRDGVPILGDTSAYTRAVQRTAEERLAKGGSISLTSTGVLATHAGSTLNVSGGQVNYTDAMVTQTRLVAADGTRYTLDKAPKDIVYTAIEGATTAATLDRWGIVPQYVASQSQSGHLEKGYVDGQAGGTLTIAAPRAVIDGRLQASTVTGLRQSGGEDAMASAAAINLGLRNNGTFAFGSSGFVSAGVGDLTVTANAQPLSDEFWANPLTGAAPTTSRIAAQTLNDSGVGKLTISADGGIDVQPGANLTLMPKATLDLMAGGAAGVSLGGSVRSEGGAVSVKTRNLGSLHPGGPTVAGGITLQPAAVIDVSGDWVNRALDGPDVAAATSGGNVTLSSARALVLDDASRIDVSGGATVATNGSVKGTDAGSVTLESDVQRSAADRASRVHLGARLTAQSLAGGGTLALHGMDAVSIGGQAIPHGVKDGLTTGSLQLSEQFFRNGAFTKYDVQAVNTLELQAGVTIAPRASNWVLSAAARNVTSGTPIASFLDQGALPDAQRKPVSLSLGAVNPNGIAGNLTVGSGAQITVDPLAAVTLAAGLNLDLEGRIRAPGGTVTLALKDGANVGSIDHPVQGLLRVGTNAAIDVSGTTVLQPLTGLLQQGSVLNGGQVDIEVADGGARLTPVEIAQGALINADGAAARLGVAVTTASGSTAVREQDVGSDGGSIKIVTRVGGAVLAGDLHAHAGDANASAGSFSLTLSGNKNINGNDSPVALIDNYTLVVQQAPITQTVAVQGSASVSAQTLRAGFADVTLDSADRIRFNGDVDLSVQRNLKLDAALITASPQSTRINLSGGSTLLLGGTPDANTTTSTLPIAGSAQLALQGGLVEFYGTQSYRGFGEVDARATSEIRLHGVKQDSGQKGLLSLQADVTLDAPQVTVSANSDFTIDAPGQVVLITGGDRGATAPLSAGGAITINASDITTRNPLDAQQIGVLRAPAGSLTLNASDNIDISSGSLLSVAGNAAGVLYGATVNGAGWTYNGQAVAAPAAKTVSLNGKMVTVSAGSTIDASGGGDLVATEFVAGSGGSSNVFAGAAGGAFAIVPSVKGYAPQDADTLAERDATGATASSLLGRQITMGDGGPVPAGTYTVLPARYALLAGAYLVKPVASSAPLALGAAVKQPDGSVIVGARLGDAGTGTLSSLTQSFQIMSSVQAQSHSEVRQTSANTYFAAQAEQAGVAAPRLPQDAGRIGIAAEELALKGTTLFNVADKAKDQGGELDISADRIRVGRTGDAAQAGVLSLDSADLNASGAAVLVLGGTRSGDKLAATASELIVDNAGVTLKAADVVLVATDRVELAAGAGVAANGSGSAGATLNLSGDGALLRVSSDPAASTVRTGTTRATGDLVIGAAAQVGGGAITAEATHATTIASDATVSAQSVTIGASRIAAGELTPSNVDATTLVLTPALAAQLGGSQSLTLRSYDGIDLYGAATLGGASVKSLTLDTGSVRVAGGGRASIEAGGVTLANTSGADNSVTVGTGTLRMLASGASGGTGQIVIGPGSASVSGVSALALEAKNEVVVSGAAQFATAGDLTIRASALQARQAANASLSALGTFTLASNGTAASADAGAGAHLAVNAAAIEQAGRIVLPSGELALNAAAGDVHFASGSSTDVSGRTKSFDGVTVATSGGAIRVVSSGRNVAVDAGAAIDVSAPRGNTGNAGSLSISATRGSVAVQGALRGTASGVQGGASLAIDSAAAVDLAALSNTLAASTGNFSEAISVRNRVGDQTLAGGNPGLSARHISLTADSGSLSIAGKLDASGASGTTIALAAGNTLALQDGASITAHSAGSVGAEVQLMAGTLAVSEDGEARANGQVLLNGGTVDTTAMAGGAAGTVLIRAQRSDDGMDVRVGKSAGSVGTSVVGVARIEVEAVKQYLASEIDDALIAQVKADNTAFAGAGGANGATVRDRVAGLLAQSRQIELRAGVEVDQTDPDADLLVSGSSSTNGWNLTSFDRLGKAVLQGTGAPVNLTLRSAGDLLVQASISDGFSAGGSSASAAAKITAASAIAQTTDGTPLDGARIRLVGGADLGAANVMATQPAGSERGNVTIGADGTDVIVRSTTGAIQIAAGNDVTLLNHQAAVYTTGKPVAGDGFVGSPVNVAGTAQSPTLAGGGSISVQAVRDVVGVVEDDGQRQYASEWLWRGKDTLSAGQASWWVRYDKFKQGLATFGGGNVTVDAGRDALNVEASAASSGYMARDAAGNVAGLKRQGGGDLTLTAGRDIVDGFVLEDAGKLTLHSGRDIVASSPDAPALQVLHGASQIDIEARNQAELGLITSFGLVSGARQTFTQPESTSLTGVSAGAALRSVAAAGDLVYRGVATTDFADSTAARHSESTGIDKIIPDSAVFAAPNGSVGLGTVIQVSGTSTRLDVLARDNASVSVVRVGGTDARQATPSLIDSTQATAMAGDVFLGKGQMPLDRGERDPVRIVAAEGDVAVTDIIQITKPLRLLAGRDIQIDHSITVQHQADNELTLVEAGRDITFAATNLPNPDFKVYGPGDLLAIAGRNIDLKTSGGFGTLGNRENAALPARSAGLTVLAGVSLGSADYARSTAWYFELLGGTGVAGFAADLAAQLAALQSGQALPGLDSAAARTFAAATIDAQIAQAKSLAGQTAFDAAVLADARQRNALLAAPVASIDQSTADKNFDALGSSDKAKVVNAALASAWTARLTTTQQHDTVLAMAASENADPSKIYAKSLLAFVAVQTGRAQEDLDLSQALNAFEALPKERQALFTNQVLISEIRLAGRTASVLTGTARDAAYERAYDALAVVFPDAGTGGDIRMGSSQMHTFQGSAITVLTPRGGVNVGEVATPAGTTPKPASSLGIVTAAGGDISIAVRDSVLVNQSRVFTVGQGDLLMWASKGDLDAGRGAKTITGAAPPVFSVDASGNFVIDTSGSFSGSGIAVLNADSTLDLYAPRGEINAGDAGIKSLGNAFLGAARFVGADNLSVAGVAVGAPPPASVGGDTAGLASVGQAATSAGTRINADDSDEEKERKRRRRLNLVLDFLGFGDGTSKP